MSPGLLLSTPQCCSGSGVFHQKSLPDDVPKGVMALDVERAQTTAQRMVPLWVNYLPAGAAEGLGGGGEELDAKPQPDIHAELLLGPRRTPAGAWRGQEEGLEVPATRPQRKEMQ